MSIKSLPKEERPLEKALRGGIGKLSDAELLALIIHTGTRKKSAVQLAEELLCSLEDGLYEMGTIGIEELTGLAGIGTAKACAVTAAVELGKRIALSRQPERDAIGDSADVARMFMEHLRYEKKEHFKSVIMNSKGEVLAVDDVSVGELSSTVVHPREVFTRAVRKSASAVIFVHNHPSGDPSPSSEDIETTKRLVHCGEILGIRVLDHVIIGDGRFCSMKGMELMR
ncbi:MAG: RadC family protein [Anaerovoracaceae bacterium]|jgi:DNA repair protein RadC